MRLSVERSEMIRGRKSFAFPFRCNKDRVRIVAMRYEHHDLWVFSRLTESRGFDGDSRRSAGRSKIEGEECAEKNGTQSKEGNDRKEKKERERDHSHLRNALKDPRRDRASAAVLVSVVARTERSFARCNDQEQAPRKAAL